MNGEPEHGKTPPSPAPAYSALNLHSELPSYVTLNLRYNQPLPPTLQHEQDSRRCTLKRGCCVLLEAICLLPVVLCLCGVVLLPSAVYFIPREYFNFPPNSSNTFSLAASIFQGNDSLGSVYENCSQGFFRDPNDTSSDGCRPSCEGLTLGRAGVGGFSVYRITVMAAAALSCTSAICFLGVFATLKRKTL